MEELWKPIPGYENLYDASSLGRIRSTPGKTTKSARFPSRVWKTRIMKFKAQSPPRRTDYRVTLWKDGKAKDHLVSRLIASAWIGPPADGMTVNHINGDYHDNRPENLEWISLSENIRHGYKTGLFSSIQKPITLVSEDGVSFDFTSMSEASRFIGRCVGYISNRVVGGYNTAVSSSGEKYRIHAN